MADTMRSSGPRRALVTSMTIFDEATLDADVAKVRQGAADAGRRFWSGRVRLDELGPLIADLQQLTLGHLYSIKDRLDHVNPSGLRAFARKTAERIIYAEHRRRREVQVEDEVMEAIPSRPCDPCVSAADSGALVRRVARRLSPAERRAFFSRLNRDSTRETATRLGCKEGAARGTISRMGKKLCAVLGREPIRVAKKAKRRHASQEAN